MSEPLPTKPAIRYIALLRAINVGGHTVKMDALRALFVGWGFSQVETFIASGNVIFETGDADARRLEQQLARGLQSALGYAVATFLRTAAELQAVAAYQPFPPAEMAGPDTALYVGFLADPPTAAAEAKLLALGTATDAFHLHTRELYWLRRGRMSDSPFSGALLEKTLGVPATLRNATTVGKLAAKYGVR